MCTFLAASGCNLRSHVIKRQELLGRVCPGLDDGRDVRATVKGRRGKTWELLTLPDVEGVSLGEVTAI